MQHFSLKKQVAKSGRQSVHSETRLHRSDHVQKDTHVSAQSTGSVRSAREATGIFDPLAAFRWSDSMLPSHSQIWGEGN